MDSSLFFISIFCRGGDFCDFGLDQLDLKKKVKAKIGEKVILRLHFGSLHIDPPSPHPELTSGGTKAGYALVSRGDDEGLELQRVPLGGEYSVVLTEDTSPVDDRRAASSIENSDVKMEEQKKNV
jgi:hypothetical protein